jgi:hypothetical protein
MRKLFTLVCCLFVAVLAKGQCYYGNLDFDGAYTCYKKLIVIDTVNYHHNLWQVGPPHKVNLDSPYSAPNVIITDTLNNYPASDTSVFILKIPAWLPSPYFWMMYGPLYRFSFEYRLDIDSNAKAYVELSKDSGSHWFNIVDSLSAPYYWDLGIVPRFDTSTNYWLKFDLTTGFVAAITDTLLMRFTLISDSAFSGKDGWMIDDIRMQYWWESVPLLQNHNLITLYPNPSHGNLYFHTDKPHKDATIAISDMQGRQVYNSPAPANGFLNLQLPNGIYTLKYSDGEEYCVKQVIIKN